MAHSRERKEFSGEHLSGKEQDTGGYLVQIRGKREKSTSSHINIKVLENSFGK